MTTIYDIKKELVQKLKDKWLNLSDKKYSPKEIYVNAYPNNKTIGVKKTTTFIVIWQGSDIGTPFISGTKYWHETNIVIEVITVPGKMVKYDNLNEQQDYIIENTKKFMNEIYKNGTYYNQVIYKGEKSLNDNNPILGSWQFRSQIFYLAEYLDSDSEISEGSETPELANQPPPILQSMTYENGTGVFSANYDKDITKCIGCKIQLDDGRHFAHLSNEVTINGKTVSETLPKNYRDFFKNSGSMVGNLEVGATNALNSKNSEEITNGMVQIIDTIPPELTKITFDSDTGYLDMSFSEDVTIDNDITKSITYDSTTTNLTGDSVGFGGFQRLTVPSNIRNSVGNANSISFNCEEGFAKDGANNKLKATSNFPIDILFDIPVITSWAYLPFDGNLNDESGNNRFVFGSTGGIQYVAGQVNDCATIYAHNFLAIINYQMPNETNMCYWARSNNFGSATVILPAFNGFSTTTVDATNINFIAFSSQPVVVAHADILTNNSWHFFRMNLNNVTHVGRLYIDDNLVATANGSQVGTNFSYFELYGTGGNGLLIDDLRIQPESDSPLDIFYYLYSGKPRAKN